MLIKTKQTNAFLIIHEKLSSALSAYTAKPYENSFDRIDTGRITCSARKLYHDLAVWAG